MTMRTPFRAAAGLLVIGLLAACGGGDDPGPVMAVDASGASSFDAGNLAAWLETYPLEPLSAAEADSLVAMRQEEQLAHDVGAVSAAIWPVPIIARITSSEATHAAAVQALLDRYGRADPLAGLPGGRFDTVALQSLHDTLADASRISALEALKSGVQIDELCIRDLTDQKAAIDNADILMVYDLLLIASRNHLRAHMTELTRLGGSYQPRYLSQAEFDAIFKVLKKRMH
jgi:hypothetical protein